MRSIERRYKRRSGTVDACRLPGERGMPKSNAPGEEWARYHAEHAGTGGFDPRTLLQRK